MIHIKKGDEPNSLKKYKSGDEFEALSTEDKCDLRNHLLAQQGYLCAYCMKRINKHSEIKIEHYEPRNDQNQLLYSNLLAVCKGNEGQRYDKQTCDTRKRNQTLYLDPQNKTHIDKIDYDLRGHIKSSDSKIDNDLNNILNLNYEYGYLKSNRRSALDALKIKISQLKQNQSAKPLLIKLKSKIENLDKNGEYNEYAGILLWYIKKKLKSYN